MAISKDKRRYTVTLTPAKVERFQALCKDFGMPSSTMSNAIDDILDDLAQVFEDAKEKGSMKIDDIFRLMGKQVMKLIEEEKIENEKCAQKTKKMDKGVRSKKQLGKLAELVSKT